MWNGPERIEALLGHKGEEWQWQNSRCARDDLGIDVYYYILHRDGVPFANMMTAECAGVGHFGHVWTRPEDRRKGAADQLMGLQMEDFRGRGGRALYLGTGFDSAAYTSTPHTVSRGSRTRAEYGILRYFQAGFRGLLLRCRRHRHRGCRVAALAGDWRSISRGLSRHGALRAVVAPGAGIDRASAAWGHSGGGAAARPGGADAGACAHATRFGSGRRNGCVGLARPVAPHLSAAQTGVHENRVAIDSARTRFADVSVWERQ